MPLSLLGGAWKRTLPGTLAGASGSLSVKKAVHRKAPLERGFPLAGL